MTKIKIKKEVSGMAMSSTMLEYLWIYVYLFYLYIFTYLLSYTIIFHFGAATSGFTCITGRAYVKFHRIPLSSNVSYQTFYKENHTVELCSTVKQSNNKYRF